MRTRTKSRVRRRRMIGLLVVIALSTGAESALAFVNLPPLLEPPACSLCTNFVTTFDPDGDGPRPSLTRIHRNIAANVPFALDVDGTLPPAPFVADLSVLATLSGAPLINVTPGYELQATVKTLTGERPTVKLVKLQSAPQHMPLRVEIVKGEVVDPAAEKTTFGYDTLTTSAPQSFVARLDESDRDANPATEQVRVEVDIKEPARRLTILNEIFKGDPAGTRTARRIRRAELIGDPSRGTQVPTEVSLDLTTSATTQRILFTRKERTTLGFELVEPGDGPRSTGLIDELPASANFEISYVDVNADAKVDKKIEYTGEAVIDRAEFVTQNAVKMTRATMQGVPTKALLTFATKELPSARNDPLEQTEVTYQANSRARRVDIEETAPDKTFSAGLENLPTSIYELTHTPSTDGGRLVYRSDASADRAEVHNRKIHRSKVDSSDVYASEFDATVVGMPERIDHLTYRSSANVTSIDYEASAPVDHVALRVSAPIAASGLTRAHRRELTGTVTGVPTSVDFILDTVSSTVDYTASARTSSAHLVVHDELPLFERATKVDLRVDDVPPRLGATLRADRLELDARGDHVGHIEVLGTNGAGQSLAADEDGLLIRDFMRPELDTYVLFGRVRGLRRALYQPEREALHIEFDAAAPPGTDLIVDSQRDVRETVWIEHIDENTRRHHSRPGTETIGARLGDYPANIVFDFNTEDSELHVDYGAARPAGAMSFTRRTTYRGDPVPVIYKQQYTTDRITGSYPASDFDRELTGGLDRMPQAFHVCSVRHGAACSAGTWTRGMFEDFNPNAEANGGSLRLWASDRTLFTLDDRSTVALPVVYTRFRADVEQAGDECEQVVAIPLLPPLCRYTEVKPGVAIKHIQLSLGDLIVQNHLESSGWIGRNVASIFAGDAANNQGYVAMDTGWRDAPEVPLGPGLHTHDPPPEQVSIQGNIAKAGSACVVSEDCGALHDRFSAGGDFGFLIGFAAKTDELALKYGAPFAAEHRVFEFDPDELIFAKHKSGHVYCGAGTSLKAGPSSFHSDFCEITLRLGSGS